MAVGFGPIYSKLKRFLFSDNKGQSFNEERDKVSGLLSIFIPQKGFYITPLLIDLNLFVFLLMLAKGVHVLSPDDQSLIKWGANSRVLTLDGQWWRLITCCFVHGGVLSFLVNMFALYCLGALLEPRLGMVRYAFAYFLTAIFSSVFSIYWRDFAVSVGAQGAIFGLCGVFLAMLATNTLQKPLRLSLLISILLFAAYNIIMYYNLIKGLNGRIDNAVNIGGLGCGLVMGFAFYLSLNKPENTGLKYITLAAVLVLIGGGSIFICTHISKDIIVYQNNLGAIADMENTALKYYTLPLDAPKEQKLTALDSGIICWNEYLKVAKENKRLRLPANMNAANQKLLQYGYLRLSCYHFLYLDVSQNNTLYQDSIIYYNTLIQDLIGNVENKGNGK